MMCEHYFSNINRNWWMEYTISGFMLIWNTYSLRMNMPKTGKIKCNRCGRLSLEWNRYWRLCGGKLIMAPQKLIYCHGCQGVNNKVWCKNRRCSTSIWYNPWPFPWHLFPRLRYSLLPSSEYSSVTFDAWCRDYQLIVINQNGLFPEIS